MLHRSTGNTYNKLFTGQMTAHLTQTNVVNEGGITSQKYQVINSWYECLKYIVFLGIISHSSLSNRNDMVQITELYPI